MKKVKLTLSAFAVLVIVGSALAFKASSFGTGTTVFCQAAGDVLGHACTGALVDFALGAGTAVPCAGVANTTPHVFVSPDCKDKNTSTFVSVAAGK